MSHWAVVVIALVVIAAFIMLMVFALGIRTPRENKRR